MFDLLDSGTDGHGHVECDENSAAECPKCGWTGKWGETYERLCRHCRAPILLREADGRWVHKDVDDNPAGEFYGWISCGGGVDDAVAEPEQEAPKHR